MDNLQDAVEKDYTPDLEIPEDNQQDQTEIPQAEVEDQSQEARVEEEGEKDTDRAVDKVDPDTEKKWREQKKRFSKIQREKHRIAAEAEQLRHENEQLKKYNQTSNQAGQAHYENSLKLKLEQAKENKRKARELNDIENEIVADEELASAVSDIRAMDSWKAQQMIQQQEIQHDQQRYQQQNQNSSQQSYDESEYETNEQTERWLKHNPWYDPKSSHYDADKADEVLTYAQALDANLAKQGREDEALTKPYFDRINNFARLYDQQRNDSRQERISNIPNVAPVRRMQGANQKSGGIQLTEDEKLMARNARVSEDDWKKAKTEDIQRQKAKQSNTPIY